MILSFFNVKGRMMVAKAFTIVVIALFFAITPAQAQLDDPGDDPDEVPLDGGLSVLLVAGAAYGGRKLWKGAKKDK